MWSFHIDNVVRQRIFDVFLVVRINKLLNNQPSCRRCETMSILRRYRNIASKRSMATYIDWYCKCILVSMPNAIHYTYHDTMDIFSATSIFNIVFAVTITMLCFTQLRVWKTMLWYECSFEYFDITYIMLILMLAWLNKPLTTTNRQCSQSHIDPVSHLPCFISMG